MGRGTLPSQHYRMLAVARSRSRTTLSACIAALACISAVPSTIKAGTVSIYAHGEELTQYCRAYMKVVIRNNGQGTVQDAFESGVCYGIVIGVFDTLSIESDSNEQLSAQRPYFPKGLMNQSLVEIVSNYLERHPELRGKVGYLLVREAFAEAFPCR